MYEKYKENHKINRVIKTIRKQAELVDASLSKPAHWRGPIRREYRKNRFFPAENTSYQRVFNSLIDNYVDRNVEPVELLKNLHFDLTGNGRLRTVGVKIGRFREFPHSSTVMVELDDMFKQLSKSINAPEFDAAFVHLMLLIIHPFSDGNGRVARLMSSLYLLKAGYKSILFTAVEQHFHHASQRYISHLKNYRLGKSEFIETILHFLTAMQYSSQWAYWLKKRKLLLLECIPENKLLEFERSKKYKNYTTKYSPLSALRPYLPVHDVKFQLERSMS